MAEASNFNGNVSMTTKDFLSPAFMARGIEQEYINPRLIWSDILTTYVGSTERSFKKPIYMVDSSGDRKTPETSDARRSPVIHEFGTEIPKIGEDTYTYTTDATVSYALGFEFDESLRQSPMNEMQVTRMKNTIRTFAASWSQHMNSEVLAEIYGSTFGTEDGSATLATYMDHSDGMSYDSTKGYLYGELDSDWYWNTEDADYLTDLMNIKTIGSVQAETYGFEANFNSMAMNITVLEDMILWGQNNGKRWELSPFGEDGRVITSIQGYNIMSLSNIDGFSSTYWDHVLFWQSGIPIGTTIYWTGNVANYARWGENAKLLMGMQDYGVDQGNKIAYDARGEYKTFINPTSEYFYGAVEVY